MGTHLSKTCFAKTYSPMLLPIFQLCLATSCTTNPGAMGSGSLKPLAATLFLGTPLEPLLVAAAPLEPLLVAAALRGGMVPMLFSPDVVLSGMVKGKLSPNGPTSLLLAHFPIYKIKHKETTISILYNQFHDMKIYPQRPESEGKQMHT